MTKSAWEDKNNGTKDNAAGIRCRYLVELDSGALMQCTRITPDYHAELCIKHITLVMKWVKDATGKYSPAVFLAAEALL